MEVTRAREDERREVVTQALVERLDFRAGGAISQSGTPGSQGAHRQAEFAIFPGAVQIQMHAVRHVVMFQSRSAVQVTRANLINNKGSRVSVFRGNAMINRLQPGFSPFESHFVDSRVLFEGAGTANRATLPAGSQFVVLR